MTYPLYKVTISTGSEKLADKLVQEINWVLNRLADGAPSAGEKSAALSALQNVRVIRGWK